MKFEFPWSSDVSDNKKAPAEAATRELQESGAVIRQFRSVMAEWSSCGWSWREPSRTGSTEPWTAVAARPAGTSEQSATARASPSRPWTHEGERTVLELKNIDLATDPTAARQIKAEIVAVTYAAAVLAWPARLLADRGDDEIAALTGLARVAKTS